MDSYVLGQIVRRNIRRYCSQAVDDGMLHSAASLCLDPAYQVHDLTGAGFQHANINENYGTKGAHKLRYSEFALLFSNSMIYRIHNQVQDNDERL
jgi:hypothetical protein